MLPGIQGMRFPSESKCTRRHWPAKTQLDKLRDKESAVCIGQASHWHDLLEDLNRLQQDYVDQLIYPVVF